MFYKSKSPINLEFSTPWRLFMRLKEECCIRKYCFRQCNFQQGGFRQCGISGYSLIEFCLTFLVVVPVLIGTLDLTKIFQARSTTKAAVNSALRCLSVVDDPSCSGATATSPLPTYNLRLLTASTVNIPLVSYLGEVKYLEGPKYEVGPFIARVLDQGYGEVQNVIPIEATVNFFQVEATASYMQIESQKVPEIVSGSSKSPSFSGPFKQLNFSGTGQTASSSSTTLGSSSYGSIFTVPTEYGGENCFGVSSYSGSLTSSSCYAGTATNKLVRGVLHVTGIASSIAERIGEDDKVCGSALLFLQEESSPGSNRFEDYKSLTGQSFQGRADNFVPRGYNRSEAGYVKSSIIPIEYRPGETTEAFQGEINFRVGRRYRIAVRTQLNPSMNASQNCAKGSVHYKVSGGSLYFPRISKIRKQINCAESVAACENPTICTEPKNAPQILATTLPAETFQSLLELPLNVGARKISTRIDKIPNSAVFKSEEILNIDRKSLPSPYSCPLVELKAGEPSSVFFNPVDCVSSNQGVTDGIHSEGIISDSSEAQALCPVVPLSTTGLPYPETSLRRWWSTKEKTLGVRLEYSSKDCADMDKQTVIANAWQENFPSYKNPAIGKTNANLLAVKSLRQTGPESPDFPAFDPADPEQLIKKEGYQCGNFRVVALKPSDLERRADSTEQPSLFEPITTRANCLGSRDPNSWKKMLAANLRQNYKNTESAFFAPKYIHSGLLQKNCSEDTQFSSLEEQFNCKSFATQDNSGLGSVIIKTTTSAENLPEVCSEACKSCQLELASFSGSLDPKINSQKEAAILKGMQELNAFSPWLSRDCADGHCAKLEIDPGEDKVYAKASIKIPLFSKSLLDSVFMGKLFGGDDLLELRYSSEQTYERKLAS